MKIKKKKVSAVLTGSLVLNMIASSGINAMAIDANQAASGNLDELNQAIVDCSLIKHYISGDMGFTEHTSDEFKKRLDYDGNGVINIYDEMKAKAIIFEYADKQNEKPVTTSVSTTAVSVSTTVTSPVTTSASEYTNPSSLKVGDKVYYKGEIHGSSTGSGKAIPVENYYVITKILDGSNPYKVQLSNLGWVAYDDLAGKKWTVKVSETTTPPVTDAPLKKGDKIRYSGTVYQSSTGAGKSAQISSGIYEISEILTDTSVPYRVQLKNYGWIAYKDAEGKQVSVTTAVTTTPKETTAVTTATTKVTTAVTTVTTKATTAVTNPSVLKKGDKISYSGKVYQTSSGNGKAIDLPAGIYEISDILNDTTVPYRVQLKNYGWIAYNDAAGKPVTTATTKATTAVTNPSVLKKGDKISYSGKVYQTSSGNGKAIDLPAGIYEISDILTDTTVPYRVQLKNYGWIAYNDAAGKPVTTAVTTAVTTPATTKATTTVTNPSVLKKGDKINYSGKVYQTSSGNGKAIDLPAGIYEISDILTDTTVPYRVQLKNYGWIAYNDAAGKPVTTAVTTAVTTPATTKATTTVTNPSVLKKGDKVKYSGKVYQSSSGSGTPAVLPSGTYEISEILDESFPYRVQLKNYGWVAYKDVAGSSSQTPAVTTAQTSQQQNASSEAADFDNSKIKIKNSSSGKYLSADSTSNESNVFQLSSDSSKNQVLTVKKYYNTDSVRLYFTDKQVVDIVKNETSDEAKKITAGCNVEVYNDCDVNAQLFKLVKVNDNAYKIVSAANPSVCLTVSGNSDGNNKDITQTSSGNIFLSDYSGNSEQLWIIEKI